MKFKKKSPTQPGNHQEKLYDINRWVDKIKNLFTKI